MEICFLPSQQSIETFFQLSENIEDNVDPLIIPTFRGLNTAAAAAAVQQEVVFNILSSYQLLAGDFIGAAVTLPMMSCQMV